MVRHYTLSSEDLALINRRRGDPNRLGFALMLCYLHFPGRILQHEVPVRRRLFPLVKRLTFVLLPVRFTVVRVVSS
jgi:TnpA family transposase